MEELIKEHKNKFDIEPIIIGILWDDMVELEKNILKAIETNTPYNELDFLTDEEKEAFEKGELLF